MEEKDNDRLRCVIDVCEKQLLAKTHDPAEVLLAIISAELNLDIEGLNGTVRTRKREYVVGRDVFAIISNAAWNFGPVHIKKFLNRDRSDVYSMVKASLGWINVNDMPFYKALTKVLKSPMSIALFGDTNEILNTIISNADEYQRRKRLPF